VLYMGGVVEGGSGPGLGAGGFGSGGSGIGPGGGWPGRGDGLGGSGCSGGNGLGRSGPLNFTSHEFGPASGYGRAARENEFKWEDIFARLSLNFGDLRPQTPQMTAVGSC
jgi:hypothetical protein